MATPQISQLALLPGKRLSYSASAQCCLISVEVIGSSGSEPLTSYLMGSDLRKADNAGC